MILFIRDGVQVTFRSAKGERERQRLRLFDFTEPTNNDFLCVRELWVRGDLYRRRADIVGFVNGLPLLFMELKNVSKDIRAAYEQNFKDYLDTVPHLFHHNAFVVLANGVDAKIGSVTSRFEHFHEWKRLAEEQPGVVDMETLLKAEKLRVDHWRDKEATRDAVRLAIRDFLWSESTGLPVDRYTEDDVHACAAEVYRHVYRVCPTVPSPYYEARAAA